MTDDETHEKIDDLIDRWHDGEGDDMPLHAWLGMTWEQYGPFATQAIIPEGYSLPAHPFMSVKVHGIRRSFPSRSQP